ncbi:hypothetical protein [Burkholderia seminalis]|uniref:hypothetical protein n=1 Tax=Burkholderia seminalis TaxID=488731 RepID=UPI002654A4EC|nr:hypothetical protein [Burkholderia seminalis]MDN7848793.1 hypothetical protein [Burkholderia seminalis]
MNPHTLSLIARILAFAGIYIAFERKRRHEKDSLASREQDQYMSDVFTAAVKVILFLIAIWIAGGLIDLIPSHRK